jgi:hypothetical protein
MTGFAEYAADGTATNDMIFDGASYNLYMEGTTDINKLARYQIGLILTVPPQSVEYNHRYRQGRIPVMDFKARLAKGKFVDEEINFPLPTETAFTIFVKNNYFVRMWLESRDKPKVQVPATQPVAAGGT